jgi:hypothetical protein
MQIISNYPDIPVPDNQVVLHTVATSNVSLVNSSSKTTSSVSRRQAVPSVGDDVHVFDIATIVPSMDYDSLKNSFIKLIREKLINDCYAFEALLRELEKEGKIELSPDFSVQDLGIL